MSLTFLVLELLLGTAELVLGPLEAFLIDIFIMTPAYIFLDPQSGFSSRTPNRATGATVYAVPFYTYLNSYLKAC